MDWAYQVKNEAVFVVRYSTELKSSAVGGWVVDCKSEMGDLLRQVTAWVAAVCAWLLPGLLLVGAHASEQETDLSLSPGVYAPPWRWVIPLTDGRTFVSNGQIAIDATLAKLGVLPASVASGKAIEGYLTASPVGMWRSVAGRVGKKTGRSGRGSSHRGFFIIINQWDEPGGLRVSHN